MQTGAVTSVSATRLAVKSTDGYTATYVVNASTTVMGQKISAVKTGHTVMVVATKSGSTLTATRVADREPAADRRRPPDPAERCADPAERCAQRAERHPDGTEHGAVRTERQPERVDVRDAVRHLSRPARTIVAAASAPAEVAAASCVRCAARPRAALG
nr:hypothetical protein [Angustibacter aerolatus]